MEKLTQIYTHGFAEDDQDFVQTCARFSVRIFGYFSHQKYTEKNPIVSLLDNVDR